MLSDAARISVITIGPGVEDYAAFGHSAVVIDDPVNRINRVYNYGTFDFADPLFYVKFLYGHLDYMLSVRGFRNEMYYYREMAPRKVYEQYLHLTFEQKNKVYKYLENNALDENKYYRYDFIKVNCSTKVLDVFTEALGDDIIVPETLENNPDKTFRELINIYMKDRTWLDFGIDMILGITMDQKASDHELRFLPLYLMDAFSQVEVNIHGKPMPLVKDELVLLEAPDPDMTIEWYLNPLPVGLYFLFLVILGTVLAVYRFGSVDIRYEGAHLEYGKRFYHRLPDFFILFISGFFGALNFFFWFISEHWVMDYNMNIIWLSPLNLIAAFLLLLGLKAKWFKYYFRIQGIAIAILIVGWFYWPQEFNPAFIPYMAALIIRSLHIGFSVSPKGRSAAAG